MKSAGVEYNPDGCRAVAAEQERLAEIFRKSGDILVAERCEAWARWYRERAEGKPEKSSPPWLEDIYGPEMIAEAPEPRPVVSEYSITLKIKKADWDKFCEASGMSVDPLAPYRTRVMPEERAVCPHPPEERSPVSGDGWLCDRCGADVGHPEEEPAPAS